MSEFWGRAVLAVIGAIVGTTATYAFGVHQANQQEARKQRLDAYIGYLEAREGTDIPRKIATRDRVLTFGSSDVIKAMAEGLRAQAEILAAGKRQEYLALSKDATPLLPWVNLSKTMRNEYRRDDPIDDRDVLTLICPDPTDRCYRIWYVRHLFDDKK